MSTSKDMDSATDTSSEILKAVLGLCDKMARIEQLVAMPHIPPATMATALLLTGITGRSEIAKYLGVNRDTLRAGESFAAFRRVEGEMRSRSAVIRRRKSGNDFVVGED